MEFSELQASSRLTLEDGTVVTACDRCRETWGRSNPPKEPPCESCRVDLREENEDAARIFNTVQGQVLTRFNGKYDVIIDINHLAIWAAIDAYGVRDRVGTFEAVLMLFHTRLKEKRDEE